MLIFSERSFKRRDVFAYYRDGVRVDGACVMSTMIQLNDWRAGFLFAVFKLGKFRLSVTFCGGEVKEGKGRLYIAMLF